MAPSYWSMGARNVSAVAPTDGEETATDAIPRQRTAMSPRPYAVASSLFAVLALVIVGAMLSGQFGHPLDTSSSLGDVEDKWSWNPIDWWNNGWGGDTSTTTTTVTTTTVTTTTTTTTTHKPFPDFQFSTSTTTSTKLQFKVVQGSPAEFHFKADEAEDQSAGKSSKKHKGEASSGSDSDACTEVGGNCWGTKCCAQEGLFCFEKEKYVAGCKSSCVPGPDLSDHDMRPWTCKPLGDHNRTGESMAPEGPLAKWVEKKCTGNSTKDNCYSSGCCKDPGMQCFLKESKHAQCKYSCVKGVDPTERNNDKWSCDELGPRTPGPVPRDLLQAASWVKDTCSAKNESCYHTGCCKDPSYQCYLRDAKSKEAACLSSCTPGPQLKSPNFTHWECTPLGGRTPGEWKWEEGDDDVADWVADKCAKPGQNCAESMCCAEPGMQCFVKAPASNGSKGWAACKAECRPGMDLYDLDMTPWTCEPLGPRTPGLPKAEEQTVADWVKKNCSSGGTNCESTGCCQDPGMQCFQKSAGWATCQASCEVGSNYFDGNAEPWSCKELGPKTPGKALVYTQPIASWAKQKCSATESGNCLETACCKDDGMQCYRKNASWGVCKQSCSGAADKEDGQKWTCEAVGLRHPGRPPCVDDGEDCTYSQCCNSKGKQCFQKEEYYATCMDTCDTEQDGFEGWSCKPLGSRQYGRELGCSWAGNDCGLTKVCCQEGYTCYSKDKHFASCVDSVPDGWEGTWLGGPRVENGLLGVNGSKGTNEIKPATGQAAGTKLYCFMVVMFGGPEESLMQAAKDRSSSIFACDLHDVLDGQEAAFVAEGDWVSVSNSEVFIDVWRRVIAMNRFQEADWTVKVDPDTVFFPDRLRSMIQDLRPPASEPIYLKNSNRYNGFLGAIEVMSKDAVELYAEFGFTGCAVMAENSGEDGYLKNCLDSIGAKFMLRDRILLSDGNEKHCDAVHATFHPYKDVSRWHECLDKAQAPPPKPSKKGKEKDEKDAKESVQTE